MSSVDWRSFLGLDGFYLCSSICFSADSTLFLFLRILLDSKALWKGKSQLIFEYLANLLTHHLLVSGLLVAYSWQFWHLNWVRTDNYPMGGSWSSSPFASEQLLLWLIIFLVNLFVYRSQEEQGFVWLLPTKTARFVLYFLRNRAELAVSLLAKSCDRYLARSHWSSIPVLHCCRCLSSSS